MKKKYNTLNEEKAKIEQNYIKKLEIEKEKTSILLRQLSEKDSKIESLNNDMLILTESNKNLLTELKTLNNILDSNNKIRELHQIEISSLRNELDSM